ncbi:radical SAM protein [Streptomyces sp. NPDC050703]|uniref:radical SAM protein n=1 Tax=Streptomyces sp. NPDC050703 TaxID=3157218 RepID=UPI00343B1CF5
MTSGVVNSGLLGSRFDSLASNTIDYWMLPDDDSMTMDRALEAVSAAPALPDASLQLYVHVPICAQNCTFCAFTGANSISYKMAERYADLVIWQLTDLIGRTQVSGHHIRSVHIGGGSPDLLGSHVGRVLEGIRGLPGCTDATEFSVEMTLSTTKPAFIEELVGHGVTKASFGVQTLDPELRAHMRQPTSLAHLPKVLDMIGGRIPIVNADLITCLPGQSLGLAMDDLQALIEHPDINAISSYLLTSGASPSLVGGLLSGALPPQAPPQDRALMRLNTYGTLLRAGWVRRGTNTYIDPVSVPADDLAKISGNECLGQSHHSDFLIGAGASAISSMPGVRLEQVSPIGQWMAAAERKEHPLWLSKCATVPQTDAALWVFPLRHEGLPQDRYDWMVANGALDDTQVRTLQDFCAEGLVRHTRQGYELTVVGEVFMGHLVRLLKKDANRRAVDDYITEGYALGNAIADGRLADQRIVNNRQAVDLHLGTGG